MIKLDFYWPKPCILFYVLYLQTTLCSLPYYSTECYLLVSVGAVCDLLEQAEHADVTKKMERLQEEMVSLRQQLNAEKAALKERDNQLVILRDTVRVYVNTLATRLMSGFKLHY